MSSFLAGAFSSATSSLAQSSGEFSVLRSRVGSDLFSAISGGLGAEIGGGNFFIGAIQGLAVNEFNHLANKINIVDRASASDSTESTYIESDSGNSKNGNILNWFDKKLDPEMYETAENDNSIMGENKLRIYTHGSSNHIESFDGKDLYSLKDAHKILYKQSINYKNWVDNGMQKHFTIELYSCNAGNTYSGVAYNFTTTNLSVKAAVGYLYLYKNNNGTHYFKPNKWKIFNP